MTKKNQRLITSAQPVDALVYHNMNRLRKAGGGAALFKYLDATLVKEADIAIFGREIKNATETDRYVEPHAHDVSEVHLFLGNLAGEALLDGEKYEITAPGCVFTPAGTVHSIRVTKGSGNLVVILRGHGYE